jgi:murein DD-endopeptidase MepM/ murein hydrolase activator NlpD
MDVRAAMDGMVTPIEGMRVPRLFHLLPGGRRLYRLGVHNGTDIYSFSAPDGFAVGWPVRAMGAGVIVEVVAQSGMTSARFRELVTRSEEAGFTSDEAMRELLGKQVVIDHGGGIVTRYAHLDQIGAGIVPGVTVATGQVIGTVGVTGTLGEPEPGTEAPHLHVEIVINGIYLGRGLMLAETR